MIVKIVKICLGLSLVLLWAVWFQFIFRQFLGLVYISQDLQAPSYVVSTNNRVLIYYTCHFQGSFLCFSFFCFLVSSVSNFCPDTRGRWWTLFQAHLFSRAVGREDTANKLHWRVLVVSQPHWACPRSLRVHPPCPHSTGSRLLFWEPLEAGPGLHAPPRSKPLRFRHSGSPQRLRLRWACVLCSQLRAARVMRCSASAVTATYRLSRPCCSVFWVYNRCTFSGRW